MPRLRPATRASGPLHRLAGFAERYLRAAALVAYTFSVGIASPRRRQLISKLARDANYEPLPRIVPAVAIADVTSPLTDVVLPFPDGIDGNVALLELLVLARVARERAPRVVFEIGTFNGRTAATLASNTDDATIVYTLDLPRDQATSFALAPTELAYVDKPAPGQLVHASRDASKVRQLSGDSAQFDFTPYRVDFVFVDGSHAYDYVVNDSIKGLSMLRDGHGTIVWHDYGEWEGVTLALNEFFGSDPRFGGLRHIQGTSLVMLEV